MPRITGTIGALAEASKPSAIALILRSESTTEEMIAQVMRRGNEEEIEPGPRFRIAKLRSGKEVFTIIFEPVDVKVAENADAPVTGEEIAIPKKVIRDHPRLSAANLRYYKVPEILRPLWEEYGWVERDSDNRVIRYKKGKWNKKNGAEVFRYAVEHGIIDKDPRKVDSEFLRNFRLSSMVSTVFGSTYKVARAAYPELNLMPWEMNTAPPNLYKNLDNLAKIAVPWLEKKTGKKASELNRKDFEANNLVTLALKIGGHGYAILKAHPDMTVWDLDRVPRGYLKDKKRKQEAIEEAARRLRKKGYNIRKLTYTIVRDEGFLVLIQDGGKPTEVFLEAGVTK